MTSVESVSRNEALDHTLQFIYVYRIALKKKFPAELVLTVVVPWLDEKAAAVYSKPRPLSEYHSRWSSLAISWDMRFWLVLNFGVSQCLSMLPSLWWPVIVLICRLSTAFWVVKCGFIPPLKDMRRNMFSSMLFYCLPFFIQLYCLVSGGRFFASTHSLFFSYYKEDMSIFKSWMIGKWRTYNNQLGMIREKVLVMLCSPVLLI